MRARCVHRASAPIAAASPRGAPRAVARRALPSTHPPRFVRYRKDALSSIADRITNKRNTSSEPYNDTYRHNPRAAAARARAETFYDAHTGTCTHFKGARGDDEGGIPILHRDLNYPQPPLTTHSTTVDALVL